MNLSFIPARSHSSAPLSNLRPVLILCLLSSSLLRLDASELAQVQAVESPPTSSSNSFYVGNRAPLLPSPLLKLPIGSIIPNGWLHHQLELEAQGMTGHLQELSKWCKFEGNAWASPTGQGHSGWEELPYWLKGYGDLG